jgi:hypothetical protein
MRAVKYAGGVFAKSRAKVAAAAVVRPRSTPVSVLRSRALDVVNVNEVGAEPFADLRSV